MRCLRNNKKTENIIVCNALAKTNKFRDISPSRAVFVCKYLILINIVQFVSRASCRELRRGKIISLLLMMSESGRRPAVLIDSSM